MASFYPQIYKEIHQPIILSINPSTNLSIMESFINQSINQSVMQSFYHSIKMHPLFAMENVVKCCWKCIKNAYIKVSFYLIYESHISSVFIFYLEHNLSAPLISMSLGQSAVFLLGGETTEQKPVPYLLTRKLCLYLSGKKFRIWKGIGTLIWKL